MSTNSASQTTAGWNPIETAPLDGTAVLAWFDKAPRPSHHIAFFDPKWKAWMAHPGRYTLYPTHWMPLPSRPGNAA